MLPYIAIIAAVLILAVALRLFAGPDEPENGTVHTREDGKQDGGTDPDEEPPDSSADGPDDVLLAA